MNQMTIGLAGNPNGGKTTLFNALTGSHQRVGNWPGVTVEKKSGQYAWQDKTVRVVDLPGTYSLTVVSDNSSIDERIACDFLSSGQAQVIVNVVDASQLERHLYLTLQLIEMRVPMVIALTMMDVAKQRGVSLNIPELERALGYPIVVVEAHRHKGMDALKDKVLAVAATSQVSAVMPSYPEEIKLAIQHIMQHSACSAWHAVQLLEGAIAKDDEKECVIEQQLYVKNTLQEDADILIADARYRMISELLSQTMNQSLPRVSTFTAQLDRLVLHRLMGIPLFLMVMYAMFMFAIRFGGGLQVYFNQISDAIFVTGMTHVLNAAHAPVWLLTILAEGVGKGIQTVLTFVPVIGAMFLFLAFLEDSGYMARAAFVVDRFMRVIGLPGKSFVAMIIGFGCNVPAVLATRTLDNKRDRILTTMMTPFMSCGARLAIYAVFTAAFFPVGGQNIVFALYMMGILMALLTGFLLRHTLLSGEPSPLVMELPPYHVPQISAILRHAWQRLHSFLFRAGKLIVPICVMIGVLTGHGDTQSWLASIGRHVTPIFAPMGIHPDNWPATVGLMTGVLAKEVVVGTLNSLYSQIGQVTSPSGVYGVMSSYFDGQVGAIAYLLFVLLYFPCVSTIAAMLREVHRGWVVFSVVWTTLIAYAVAVLFYQMATVWEHPGSSLLWITLLGSAIGLTIATVRLSSRTEVQYDPC